MPASPIRKLAPLADAAKQRGIHVYHLNLSLIHIWELWGELIGVQE